MAAIETAWRELTVALEVSDGIATVGPGLRLGDLYAALARQKETIPAGCGATVGIGGQALGGGSLACWAAAADSLRTRWSRHRWCWPTDAWCSATSSVMRTCSGRSVVRAPSGTAWSRASRSAPSRSRPATSFHLEWPYERAAALICAWQEWSPAGPDDLAASLLLTVGGEAGADPMVHLFGSMIGSEIETAALLDEFVSVAGAGPTSSESAHMRYGSLKGHLAERGPGDQEDEHGRPYIKSEFFRELLPAGAVEALVELFVRGRRPGEARKLDFMSWGGAYNRVPTDASAFPHREELFLLEHSVVVPAAFDATATEGARAWLSDSWEPVHPSGSGGVYANFPDTDLPDEHRAYWGGNLERVRCVKEKYDPECVFGRGTIR